MIKESTTIESQNIITNGWAEYQLVDSGQGRKLEQYGDLLIDRPEPQAMWQRRLPDAKWDSADAVFTGGKNTQQNRDFDDDDGRWSFRQKNLDTWHSAYENVRFFGRFTPFRHVGFFPEQAPHWDWARDRLSAQKNPSLLNLFAYTGVASLLAAQQGAEVTHLDASKKAISFARENQSLSAMTNRPIRWICDDAAKFVAREVRRGRTYQGILLDPPKFGRGPNKETWNLFDDLPEMLKLCKDLLDPDTGFLILTTYAVRASHFAFYELCREIFDLPENSNAIQTGELLVQEQKIENCPRRLIPTSMYCRIDLSNLSSNRGQ